MATTAAHKPKPRWSSKKRSGRASSPKEAPRVHSPARPVATESVGVRNLPPGYTRITAVLAVFLVEAGLLSAVAGAVGA